MNDRLSDREGQASAVIPTARRQALGDLLRRSARRYPDKSAIECGAHIRWTYSEFDALCDRLAAGLLSEGLVLLQDDIAVFSWVCQRSWLGAPCPRAARERLTRQYHLEGALEDASPKRALD